MKSLVLTASAAVLALGAMPAAAQVAGTYSGTSADGNGVTVNVATDADTGMLAVTGATVFFSAMCSDGSTLNSGWGYGTTQDISAGRVESTVNYDYFSIDFKLKFSGNGQSANGSISTVSPDLLYLNGKAKKALFCASNMQPLTLTLQPPGAKAPPALAHGVQMHLTPPGRVQR